MIKVFERLGIQGICLNMIKAISSKWIAKIKLNGKKLKAISLKSETRQGFVGMKTLSSSLLNIVLGVLARAIRQLQGMKRIQLGKENVKESLVTDDTIAYISNSKNSPRKLLQ